MKQPKIDQIKDALVLIGWKEDRYGHMQKTTLSGVTYRVKVQAISVRFELRREKEWLKVSNAYTKDVVVLEDGRVQIGKVILKTDEK